MGGVFFERPTTEDFNLLPKFPIQTSFDPSKSDYAQELWSIRAGKILMLLWRPGHLCGPGWWKEALVIARLIEGTRPRNESELFRCFGSSINQPDGDFTKEDCREFSKLAIDFFTSKRHVPYEGVVSGNASMVRGD